MRVGNEGPLSRSLHSLLYPGPLGGVNEWIKADRIIFNSLISLILTRSLHSAPTSEVTSGALMLLSLRYVPTLRSSYSLSS